MSGGFMSEKILDENEKRILEGHKKNAPILRLKLLLVCKKFVEMADKEYTLAEDEVILTLANELYWYTTVRARMNDLGVNIL